MLLNASKISTTKACWKRGFNAEIRRFKEENLGMKTGSAMHHALALGMASKDWTMAKNEAYILFKKTTKDDAVLPGDEWMLEEVWNVTEKAIDAYRDNYVQENYQVLMPECRFSIALPGSEHNDITTHWLDGNGEHFNFIHWAKRDENHKIIFPIETPWGLKDTIGDEMDPAQVLAGKIRSPHKISECPCWLPHRLNGITDAIVKWNQMVWLHEHKKTPFGGEQFFQGFQIDIQPTCYLYGVWKSIGILPKGVIVNAIIQPTARQVEGWNKRRKHGPSKSIEDYIGYEREPIVRTKEDLVAFEKDAIEFGDEYEARIISGRWPEARTKDICAGKWKCDYFQLCLSHDSPEELEGYEQKKLVQIEKKRKEREANGGDSDVAKG